MSLAVLLFEVIAIAFARALVVPSAESAGDDRSSVLPFSRILACGQVAGTK
jgi:hypothetical protein